MGPFRAGRVLGVVVVTLVLTSCGSEKDVTVLSAEEMDAVVLTLEYLGEGWSGYDHAVITQEWREEMMGAMDLCPEAGAEATGSRPRVAGQSGGALPVGGLGGVPAERAAVPLGR